MTGSAAARSKGKGSLFSSKHGFGIFHYVWEDSGLWTGIKLTAVPVPSRDFFNLSIF